MYKLNEIIEKAVQKYNEESDAVEIADRDWET